MLRKLPPWAWVGGGVLSFIAGSINAVGFLGFRHQPITHLTGTTTALGVAVAQGDLAEAWHWLAAILSFVAGAVISGFIVRHEVLRLGRRYGVVLVLESLLLLTAVPLLHGQSDLGLYLAAMACGLQNAMVSTYSGAVFRTTHVTGIFTDLGIYLGQRLRGEALDPLRLHLYLLVSGSFLAGVVAGSFGYARWSERTLLGPAVLTGMAGLAYALYQHHRLVSARREAAQAD
ncbi:YoaK family protein [Dyella sp.]|jgi:uncharacterized membrane protein YoaK (UPF0700 family)|uniref:YoaK family protein n=1 Tax=Dyella sp. TaxID=1869338 RepID=UPI002D76A377|nr:YoaK family protein [Dyella sp.]HET6433523.1 YoaK family protein [Dyella sp.]